MKIGIVCYPTFGGSGVMATELGIGLAKKGHEVHFISYKRPARLTSYYSNIYLHEVGSFEYPLFEFPPYESSLASKIVDVAIHERLDVLHVHYAIPHAAVAFMAKQILATKNINLPVITTLHGTDITLVGLDKSMCSVVEFSINQSDYVTAVSHSLKKETESHFDITTQIGVIYNFVDTQRFERKENKALQSFFAPNNEKIIVHTSNFRKVKRIPDIIHAYSKIDKVVNAKLLLVGDGPERKNAEELCRQLGTCSKIQFLGKQDAVEEILSIADLFILPSQNESFGLAALEAMSCEVPVISSNAGGLPEVNLHGETGFVCNVGDVDDMADKAIQLLSNDSLLETFRKNAKTRSLVFNKEGVIQEYEKVYQSLYKESQIAFKLESQI